ncbi:Na/Pi cotransporter family protein [Candidatus Cryosericum septentrionale]|jgi:phosphate:Na+ symporter|uniref:Na/Pi cotransporter family protein n=1 Tax=Candidatus Cryosericum septentrionale TaxID=2290913 RepID=A0A398DIH5_9BACT|nr:Na/Pi cotransporter family protein [Candidatus Cryosericum septentrionale]RIE15456.1 Na/Pi cotransporter family protein [Candidatus Cryosericum septentrionale]
MRGQYVSLAMNLVIGLSFFLYGMKLLGDGLQKAAGDSLRRILQALTNKPIRGVLVGMLVTGIIQSSGATTVMVVGFANAGLMTLRQAMGVIFGANIGTTITAQIIVLKLDKLVWLFMVVGVMMEFFVKRKTSKAVGEAILGFGILFFGLYFMADTLAPLKDSQGFINFLVRFGKVPILGVGAGAVFTALIQSSSVTTSLVVALAMKGMITLPSSISLILGANIGTTVTAGLASLGANATSRRAALTHFLFNFMGTVIMFPFLKPFAKLVEITASTLPHQVANAHTMFNLLMTIIALIFINPFEKLVIRLLPSKEKEVETRIVQFIDERVLATPSVALSQATQELYRMGRIAYEMVDNCRIALFENRMNLLENVLGNEELVNSMQKEITGYLTKITEHDLSEAQGTRVMALMHAVNDIERVGDHATNLVELIQIKDDKRLKFSNGTQDDLKVEFAHVLATLDEAMTALRDYDAERARHVKDMEDRCDLMTKECMSRNISRLNTHELDPQVGVVVVDLFTNLERISDHSDNIADVVLGVY